MKKELLLLFVLLLTMSLSFSQGTGEVIITEIHNRPQKPTQQQLDAAIAAGGTTSNSTPNEGHTEWFEVYNTTASPVVMDGWTITDESSSSNVTTIGTYTIQPGEYAVFTGFSIPEGHGLLATDTFGDYIYDYKKPSFNNESSYDAATDSACPDGVTIEKADGTLVDTVEYDYGYNVTTCSQSQDTDHDFPAQGGSSRTSFQLDNNFLTAADNDNKLYWTYSTNVYDATNTQKGTPGAANDFDPSLSVNTLDTVTFSVYPIPATNYINIKTSNDLEISNVSINDILGKQVLYISEYKNNRLDVSSLNNGIYFMNISANGKLLTKKIIIQ